jgi:hypothetical protein
VGTGQVRRHCQRTLNLGQSPVTVAAVQQHLAEKCAGFGISAVQRARHYDPPVIGSDGQ